ncbi:hypothetical protein WJX73_000802 [Symbiochloris irregularis]|uniref:Uncharacterized protein n=1 Tax=Symbiochloris irregularis TaxID=706552 RepID=A0AAW1PV85_9CHLO
MSSKYPVHAITSEPAAKFALGEVKKLWPFVAGFAVTGTLLFNIALGVTDEQVKNSKMANPNAGLEHH